MSSKIFWIVILFLVDIIAHFINLIYRIVTQEDKVRTWKESALASLFTMILYILIVIWLLYW